MPGSVRLSYACFKCRRSWKGGKFMGISFDRHIPGDASVGTIHCPECGKPGICMGRNFKPPKRADLKGWKAAKTWNDNRA